MERSRRRSSWPLPLVLSVVLHAGMIAGVVVAFWPAGVLIALRPDGDGPGLQTARPFAERLAFLTAVASGQTTPPSASSPDQPGVESAHLSPIFSWRREVGEDDSEYATMAPVPPPIPMSDTRADKPPEHSSEFKASTELGVGATAPQTAAISSQIDVSPDTPVARARSDKGRSTKRQQKRPAFELTARSTRAAKREAALSEAVEAGSPISDSIGPSAASPVLEPAYPKVGLPPVGPSAWVQAPAPSRLPSTYENRTEAFDERSEWLRRLRPIPLLGWSK